MLQNAKLTALPFLSYEAKTKMGGGGKITRLGLRNLVGQIIVFFKHTREVVFLGKYKTFWLSWSLWQSTLFYKNRIILAEPHCSCCFSKFQTHWLSFYSCDNSSF